MVSDITRYNVEGVDSRMSFKDDDIYVDGQEEGSKGTTHCMYTLRLADESLLTEGRANVRAPGLTSERQR
jgi:hypothetical protein